MQTCIFHLADHDGRCSAAIVKRKFPDCKLIGMDYSLILPWDEIAKDDEVYMVDFCLAPANRMVHLSKKCHLIWIDHHASSINDVAAVNLELDGLRVIGKSGCELTWEFLFPNEDIPLAVHLIGRHDVFDHDDTRAIDFFYGLLQFDTNPSNDQLWNELMNDDNATTPILTSGAIIAQYQAKMDAEFATPHHFDAKIGEHLVVVMNSGRCNSMGFDSVWYPEKYDAMVAFVYTPGGKISVSIYTTKPEVNVSTIAKSFGGGGHVQASGWIASSINEFLTQVVPVGTEPESEA